MAGILKAKQRKALFEVVCLGQHPGGEIPRPTRAEYKAAKWSAKVLREQRQYEHLWKKVG